MQEFSEFMERFNKYKDINELLEENKYKRVIEEINPVELAACFSGLLLEPKFQSNCYRLEELIYVSLTKCKGTKSPCVENVVSLFNFMSDTYESNLEDPAEDVFTATVHFDGTNYLLLEGLWEDNSFFTQRLLDVVDSMPNSHAFGELKEKVEGLLKLSDGLCKKAGLYKYIIGNEQPVKRIDMEDIGEISKLKSSVLFIKREIENLRINHRALVDFVTNVDLSEDEYITHGNTELEGKPLYEYEGGYLVILPTSIGLCIRRKIIEFCYKSGLEESLRDEFICSYLKHMKSIPLLGEISNARTFPAPVTSESVTIRNMMINYDHGNIINFIFVFDDFDSHKKGWINSKSRNHEEFNKSINKLVELTQKQFKLSENVNKAYAFIIHCGWGRTTYYDLIDKDNVITNHMSYTELVTISFSKDISLGTFLSFIDQSEEVSRSLFRVSNPNGLLNLYAWAKNNKNSIIPHNELPITNDIVKEELKVLQLPTNELLSLRSWNYDTTDEHYINLPDRTPTKIRKYYNSTYFKDKSKSKLYVSIENIIQGKLLAVIKGVKVQWICQLKRSNSNRSLQFKFWETICLWLEKIDKRISQDISTDLSYISIELDLNDISEEFASHITPLNFEELKNELSIDYFLIKEQLKINCHFSKEFMRGFYQEENFAESCIVNGICEAINEKGLFAEGVCPKTLVDNVIGSEHSKQMHMLTTQEFSDYIKSNLPDPIGFDKFYDATSRIDLGWKITPLPSRQHINGIQDCTRFLNNLVDHTVNELIQIVSKLNKTELIQKLLTNYTALTAETNNWKRTSRAAIHFNDSSEDVIKVIAQKLASNNSSSLGTRIALEIAACHAQDDSGRNTGDGDISKLITKAMQIFTYGGWSDCIKYQASPASLIISISGDILFDHDFNDKVIEPYGSKYQHSVIEESSKNYTNIFRQNYVEDSDVDFTIHSEFEESFKEEFGFRLDDGIRIVHLLQELGIEKNEPTYLLSKGTLYKICLERLNLPIQTVKSFFRAFTYPNRECWGVVPKGYQSFDIFPWRFKRRLSTVSKPIFSVNGNYIVAPEIIEKSYRHIVNNSYLGLFDDKYYTCKRMRSWVGKVRSQAGIDFNSEVASRYSSLGWYAEHDITLTKLLNMKTEKDYGDIDVLAYNENTSELYLIECKDLEAAKTPSEIARQVFEFRGRDFNGKPDRLKKHLNRIEVIKNNIPNLKKYLNTDADLKISVILLFSKDVPLKYMNDHRSHGVKVEIFNGDS